MNFLVWDGAKVTILKIEQLLNKKRQKEFSM